MPTLSDYPYFPVEFTKDGALFDPAQLHDVLAMAAGSQVADLIVVSHGWNNNKEEALELYMKLAAHLRAVEPAGSQRALGLLGVFWPSKRFTERELIPGGGAATLGGGPDAGNDVSTKFLETEIDRFKEISREDGPDLEEAKGLIDQLESDPAARAKFLKLILDNLDPPQPDRQGAAAESDETELTLADLDADADALFNDLMAPVGSVAPAGGLGGAAGGIGGVDVPAQGGGAAGLGSPFRSAKAAAERLLNLATYYQMKERAGVVGKTGVAEMLRKIRSAAPRLRIHMVGHSFGGRLVAAAVQAAGAEVKPASMTLLQAAFSHNGFSPSFEARGRTNVGGFRSVVGDRKVAGPIVITHTVNDKAVGLAYALASRVARQVASGLGDAADVYGGLGRNGALHLPDQELGGRDLMLVPTDQDYQFRDGLVYNLKADRFITDHGDVANDATAHAIHGAIDSA